jgi:glycosyltransferase involved in cell wall biosynthesis
MKVAIVSSLFAPFALGGAEQVAAQIAEGLDRAGHTVDIISTCRRRDLRGRLCQMDRWNGIRVWRIAPWNLYWRFDRETEQPGRLKRTAWHLVDLWNPTVVRPLTEVLEKIAPDIVNTHNIDGFSPLVWKLARRHAGALIHTLHDYHLICPRALMIKRDGTSCPSLCGGCRIYSAYNGLFQDYVDAFISPAQVVADLHRSAGWTGPRVIVIPNAADPPEVLSSERSPSAPLQVVFMARLVSEKGCEAMLKVVDRFRRDPGIHFHVAGKGPYEQRFSALSGVVPNLTFHGHVNGLQKMALLSAGDVFLQLSEWRENAPLSLLEARQHGLYLVGTNIGGIPEIIRDPSHGCLIPVGDSQFLDGLLEQQIANRGRLRSERKIREQQGRAYGVREMNQEYLNVFASLTVKSRPESPAERHRNSTSASI